MWMEKNLDWRESNGSMRGVCVGGGSAGGHIFVGWGGGSSPIIPVWKIVGHQWKILQNIYFI